MSDAFSLILDGDLELMGGEDPDGAFWFETLAQGASFGDPAPVEVAIASLLRDGSLVERTSDGNRAVTFQIKIKSSDPAGVAQGRARLDRLLGRRTTLVWRDGDYPATVFDVETSSAVRPGGFDDLEYLRNEETVALRFECLPYARSENKILDVATSPPGSGSGSVFYAAESTTGWATYAGGSPDVSASFAVDTTVKNEGAGSIKSLVTQWEPGAVFNTGNGTGGVYGGHGGTGRDQVTGLSLDTATGGYVSVAIRFDPANDLSALQKIWQQVAGAWVEVTSWAAIKFESTGFVHYRWAVDDGLTITGLRFETLHKRSGQPTGLPRPYTWFDDFRFAGTASTEQQVVKNITVFGSARTTGSLRIASGTDSVALGQVLVATVPTIEIPAGFSPEVRPYVTQGTLTADATAQGGGRYTPDASSYSTSAGAPIFNVPVAMLRAGAYTVVTLVKTSGGTVTSGIQAQLNLNGTLAGPTQTAEITRTSTTTDWQFVPVGTVALPPVPINGADGSATVRILCKGASLANIYLIPAWSVGGRSVADFSIIDCGSGLAAANGPSSFLWIDSPDANQPQGGYWRGPTSDRLNTRSAWPDAVSPGLHTFQPGEVTGFLAVTKAQAPTLALEYFPAWLGSAAI